MAIKMLLPVRTRQSRADAVGRRDARLSEEITGWAVSALFPIRDVPNMYARFPWRRLRKTRGLICGMLFAVELLLVWPFELTWELIWSSDSGSEPFG
jgi:uncharacterized protein with HEPN domain